MLDLAGWWRGAGPAMAGLDIGSSAVRLVELARGGQRQLRLACCACEALPRGAVVDGHVAQIDAVAEIVRRVWQSSGSRARHVALAMPAAAVVTKRISLPAGLSDERLAAQVESAAAQHLPFALDDVRLDFDVLGPAPRAPDEVEVVLAAARRDQVDERVAIAEAAGLTATVMDIESDAACAALRRVAALAAVPVRRLALVQIGAHLTHFTLLCDGVAEAASERPLGGHRLTQDIARAYRLSYELAEARKHSGALDAAYRSALLAPFVDGAARDIAAALRALAGGARADAVERICVAGGGALLPGLAAAIARHSGVDAALLSPFEGMPLPATARAPRLPREAPAYLIACGLALRSYD